MQKNHQTGQNSWNHRIRHLLMSVLMHHTYDCIMCIDTKRNWYEIVSCNNETLRLLDRQGEYDDAEKLTQLREIVHTDDWQRFLSSRMLEHIMQELEHVDLYEFTIRFQSNQGRQVEKLQYRWLPGESGTLMLTWLDITQVFRAEQKKKELLEDALIAAKQANAAKSNFLSRMSHEIRTPMNAIIGMSTIAAQSIGQDEKITDCISKIGISARYLLSLINDILDMSRIESGRMLLKNESFRFSEFINGINTIIYGQAESKGLDYECLISQDIEEAYIGDAMKLQQVLINVLGNAVKYTESGKISLEVRQISRKKEQALLRFVVNDTGCGISDEFLPKIFDAFEQEDTTSTKSFAGTGLGLAISKNIVNLMGGAIRVRSIVGVGSEFSVDIPLAIDAAVVLRMQSSEMHFEKLHTLVVDDDAMVCEHTVSILQEIGMVSEWVTTGREAVARVTQQYAAHQQVYDFIIIDWKMPEMDGIETARQIRRVVGPDVTIIIMTAYDWSMIEREARAAGVNMLISKPLFKSSLISAFQRAAGNVPDEVVTKFAFDFSGRRALVVEDNQINAEIAVCLLEDKNFQVEVAENGLKALELFTTKPVGYYDAILMDVRMPLMDGLQATVNIRHWSKADARTIPIIAMTANAFDEDVEKSRAAGMNAHLAKPIEPEVLYRTLYHLLFE